MFSHRKIKFPEKKKKYLVKWNISRTRGKEIKKDSISSGVANIEKKIKYILKKVKKRKLINKYKTKIKI